jgi:hypothetical protein
MKQLQGPNVSATLHGLLFLFSRERSDNPTKVVIVWHKRNVLLGRLAPPRSGAEISLLPGRVQPSRFHGPNFSSLPPIGRINQGLCGGQTLQILRIFLVSDRHGYMPTRVGQTHRLDLSHHFNRQGVWQVETTWSNRNT